MKQCAEEHEERQERERERERESEQREEGEREHREMTSKRRLTAAAQAIDFIQNHNDKELWEDLINQAMTNPNFVSGALSLFLSILTLAERLRCCVFLIRLRVSLIPCVYLPVSHQPQACSRTSGRTWIP